MPHYHLAQVNIALPKAPLDSVLLRDFVAGLAPVNATADASPGFVWRLQTEDGDATAIRAFDDDRLIVNMSVWESLEALAEFVYKSDHRTVLRQRGQWFSRLSEAYAVLWWIPSGHLPTVPEAKARLEVLRRKGPTAEAFTFRSSFPPPDDADVTTAADDD